MNPLARVGAARQRELLRMLRGGDGLTRGEIGLLLGLSISQVSRLTGDLIAAGLIDVDPQPAEGLGRPPGTLRLAAAGPWVIGMEVGSGRRRGVVANLRGEPVARRNAPLPAAARASESAALDAFARFATRLLAAAGVSPGQTIGLGIALWAMVDPVEGVVLEWSEEPAWRGWWRGVPFREALARRLGIDAVAIDDTVRMRAAAERLAPGWAPYAESYYLYLLADSGIGAAMVIGGRPYLGRNRIAGDIGHVIAVADGPACPCGRRGCLEALASARAIERAASLLAGRPIGIPEVAAAAAAGDRQMEALLVRAGEHIASVLAPLVTMSCPDLLVLGGSVTGAPPAADALRTRLLALAPPRVAAALRVTRSALGDEAGELGAVQAILEVLLGGPGPGPGPGPMPRAADPLRVPEAMAAAGPRAGGRR
ncbi:MAG: ROK family transcriptional regulator [Chloroflexota bacterium]